MKYQVKINTVESECKNVKENDGKTIEESPAKAGKQTLLCLVSVWSRSWESPEKKLVTSMKCLRKMENGVRPGQEEEMTMDEILANKELLAGLDQEIEKFNAKRYNEFRIVRHSVVSATKQVVSGIKYQVKINTVESECKNVKENDGKTIEECPAKAGKQTLLCLVSVWSRSWESPEKKLVTSMKCLRKMENTGGIEEMTKDEIL